MSTPFYPVVWFYPDAVVTEVREGVWKLDNCAFCKRYADKAALAREIRLCGHLADCGLPVPSTIQTVDELDWHAYKGSFYHLTTALSGSHIRYPLSEPERFGTLMAGALRRLQDALASYPHAADYRRNDLCGELEGWVAEKFPEMDEVLAEIRATSDELRRLAPDLPRQLIHRDFHTGNVLFDGGRLTGLLDFELVREEFRVFDLAYLLSSTLGDNWRQPAYWQRFLRFARAAFAAYVPTDAERRAAAPMMRAVCLLFAAFWKEPAQIENTLALTRFLRAQEEDIRSV